MNIFKVYGNARIIFCIQIDWTPYHDQSQIFVELKINDGACWNLVKVVRNLLDVYGNALIIFCIQIDWTPYHDQSQIFVKLKIISVRVGILSKLSGIYSMCTSCVCLSIFCVIFFKTQSSPSRCCVYPPRFCVIFLKETYQDFAYTRQDFALFS